MNKFTALMVTTAALCAASPALAQSSVSGDGKSVTLYNGDDLSFTMNFASTQEGVDGARASITFNYLGTSSPNSYNFSFMADNTSIAPSPNARLVSFGFDAESPSSISETGPFSTAVTNNGNFNGLGKVDVCFWSGQNCNGGGNTGIAVNDTPQLYTFTLNYGPGFSAPLTMSNFRARWQSTEAPGSSSGPGAVISSVPEPSTWAMMLLGFGTVGYGMRRRKKPEQAFA